MDHADLDELLTAGITIRRATAADVPGIVALLKDDGIGAGREHDHAHTYSAAFRTIDADPAHDLVVLDDGGSLAGTLQLTVIPGLARGGVRRGQIEAVRIASSHRGQGLGELLLRWAFARARQRRCALIQLTTDRRRQDAHRFYEGLGMTATHLGYKLEL